MNAVIGAGAAAPARTPTDLPLGDGGTTFIEASAGTGKTHALTTLVARLVVEEGRALERILVVTFTRAATAELRDRIRRTLGAALAALKARVAGANPPVREPALPALPALPAAPAAVAFPEVQARGATSRRREADPQAADPQARELLARWERPGAIGLAEAARRLEAAMHDVDRAGVYTIHGFCQRVLADLAFECGFPFGFEVSGGDGGMVAGAVRDFWRRRLYPASTLLVRHAVGSGFLPDEIAGWAATRRSKTGVVVVGGERPSGTLEEWEARWRGEFDAAQAEWVRHRETFRAELLEGDWLNRGRYRRPKIEADLQRLEATFAAPEPRLPEEGAAGCCGRAHLSEKCRKGRAVPENPLFDALDRLEEASQALRSDFDRWLRWARGEVLAEVRETIRRRVREDRRLGYDDLLIEFDRALDGAGGARLTARIRHEFPCALIDEYQDTDPLQARIFERIYGGEAQDGVRDEARDGIQGEVRDGIRGEVRDGIRDKDRDGARDEIQDEAPGGISGGKVVAGSPDAETRPRPTLIVVGDPKQSIYRFRGADVFAYLAARRTARERLHLESNWRSVPALVEAVNAVFAGAFPFIMPEIEYRPVAAARSGGNPLRLPSSAGDAAGEDGDAAGGASVTAGEEGIAAGGSRVTAVEKSIAVDVGCDGPGEDDDPPLQFLLLPRSEEGKLRTKESSRPVAVGTTANEIARLLALGAHGEAAIEGVPLTGADVAVLVRTREQGRQLAEALRERGVRSVEIDDGSVFDTPEAEQVERLLWALAEPGREAGVRGALAGDLFGLDARALVALDDDEETSMRWADRLGEWRSDWESRGIGAVLLRLLEGEGGAEHLLGYRDGARRLTNVRHLAELLQEAETQERFSPAELAAWLSHRRRELDRPSESALLRFESDEQLVRILTVHGAKGLEFPVVFCPFAWDARSPERRTGKADATYHLDAAQGYREVIDLDPDERARSIEWLEDFCEEVRLLYVALTRAKYRCVVTWGQVGGAEHAPLAWLLHRSGDEPDAVAVAAPGSGSGESGSSMREPGGASTASENGSRSRVRGATPVSPENGLEKRGPDAALAALEAAAKRFSGLGASAWIGEMEAYAQRFPHAISVAVLDSDPPPVRMPALPEPPPPALAARELGRPLRRIRQMTSFTALSAEALSAGGSGRPRAERDGAEAGRPDHDQHEAPADDLGEEARAAGGAGHERTAFTFPRGPVAGSCLHRIFEHLDESARSGSEARNGSETPDLDAICREALDDFGIGGDWRPAARAMVERTRAVRLHEPGREGRRDGGGGPDGSAGDGGFRLDDPAIRRLVELEFHFPVQGLDRDRLAARLVEHGYPNPFARPAPGGSGEPRPPPIHGFLRGYVDLVVEHAGRWYVLDYKSNWLGPDPADYAPGALDDAIRAGGYPLQYLIYLVALHRYLATRLPGYDYERHVGGAFYLFVRGIDPAAGMSRGVYFHRPSAACLHALDECFGGTI